MVFPLQSLHFLVLMALGLVFGALPEQPTCREEGSVEVRFVLAVVSRICRAWSPVFDWLVCDSQWSPRTNVLLGSIVPVTL